MLLHSIPSLTRRMAAAALWAVALWARCTPSSSAPPWDAPAALPDGQCFFQVHIETASHPITADDTFGNDLASTDGLEHYEQQLAQVGRAYRLLTAVPQAALAGLSEQELASVSESLARAQGNLEVIVGLVSSQTKMAAQQASKAQRGDGPVMADLDTKQHGAHRHIIDPQILPPEHCEPLWGGTSAQKPCLPRLYRPFDPELQDDGPRGDAAQRHSSVQHDRDGPDNMSVARQFRVHSVDDSVVGEKSSGQNSSAWWENTTVKEMFAVHAPPKRSHWLFIINLLLIVTAFVFILGYIVMVSPVRGATMTRNDTTGAWEVRHRTANKFIQVCLPFWLPVDKNTTGYLFLWLFLMTAITALCMGFLFSMALLRLTIACCPTIFDGYKGTSLKLEAFRNSTAGFCCLAGLFALPANYAVFRHQLKGRERQWCLLTLQLFLMFQGTFVGFVGTFTGRTIQNWLVTRNADDLWHYMRTYNVIISFINIGLAVLGSFVSVKLGWIWNRFMINYMLDRYIANRAYYHLNSNSNQDDGADNPDARICADLPQMVSGITNFVLSILMLIQGLITALMIVWATVPFWTMGSVIYTMCGSSASMWFSWQFMRLHYEIEKKGADFRFSLYNLRTMAEPIALYSGQDAERKIINQRWEGLLEFQLRSIYWGVGFGLFEQFYAMGLTMTPNILLFRRYFQGKIDFGGLMQVTGAFGALCDKLNYLHDNTDSLAHLGNSVTRLAGLLSRMEELAEQSKIEFAHKADSVELRDIVVRTPAGDRTLLTGLNLTTGGSTGIKRLLICGASGVGKSSLLRCIAGLWLNGGGKIGRPAVEDCMFLPQQPYMPVGNLRTQFRYPDVDGLLVDPWKWGSMEPMKGSKMARGLMEKDKEIMPFLRAVGLGELPGRFADGFDQNEDWKRFLSLGEQQRVAAVRCMLKSPKLAVFDEATSALSEIDEDRVYQIFRQLDLMYISVGHRTSLVNFHDQVMLIADKETFHFMTPDEYLKWHAQQLALGRKLD